MCITICLPSSWTLPETLSQSRFLNKFDLYCRRKKQTLSFLMNAMVPSKEISSYLQGITDTISPIYGEVWVVKKCPRLCWVGLSMSVVSRQYYCKTPFVLVCQVPYLQREPTSASRALSSATIRRDGQEVGEHVGKGVENYTRLTFENRKTGQGKFHIPLMI